MNILILDDERIAVDCMVEGIEWDACGITEIKTAYYVEEAMKIIQEEKIDILLSDIEMPGMNGIEFLSWLRKQDYQVNCIFLTCHARFDYARDAIRLGCCDYILKPAPYEEIQEKILQLTEKIEQRNRDEAAKEIGKQWLEEQKKEIGGSRSTGQIIQEVEEFVFKNIAAKDLTVGFVARHFNFHPDYLNRIYQKEKNTSLGKYIVKRRMEVAAELLRDNDNVMKVAECVGYTDYSYFSKSFKKMYGCTPAAFRKNIDKT